MVKFSFFCVEQVYHGKNPCGLRFLGRDKEKNKIDITVDGPRPYFYILTSEKERVGTFPCILEDGFKSMYGDVLTRVSLSNPWDIKDLVKNFSKTFEADVSYPTRVLIDKDIYTGIEVTDDGDIKHCDIDCEPRIMNLDVETDYQGGSNKDMMRPLIAISFYDNYTDTIYSLSYKEIPETYQKRYSYKSEVLKNSDGTFKDVKVVEIAVEGEVELLNLFKAYVKNFDVDVFTGWNINFDMIYILRRMETLNLDPDSLSPVGKYTWDTGDANGSNRGPRKQYVDNSGNFRDVPKKTRKFGSDSKKAMIRGRTIIDILKGYRRMKWKGVEGFKLDSVAKKEFGVGKIEYKGWMSDFWKNDFNNFIKYNIRDVEMCLAIDRKYSVIDSLLNIRKISGCEMSDILQNSRIFDVYILRYCLGKFVLPTKKYSSEGAQKIEGGFVLEPKVGLHKYVAALDLKGLYPSIMLSFNMSPETVDNRGDIIVGNGVRFKRETGILKDILVDLIKKRDELRAMLKTPEVFNDKDKYTNIYKRQYYYKTFSNCFSDDTNILTINGIKNIKDIKVGEFVYSINPKTKFVEIKPVIKTYKYKFNEQMYEFKSFKNYHFKVTSRHKMIVQNKWTGEILEMTASELYGVAQKTNKYRLLNHLPLQKKDHYELVDLSKYINKEEFIITDTEIVRKPLRENCPFTLHENRYVNKHDFLKFFGWFISEGHFHKVNKNSGFFSITQEQVKNHKELKTMFVSLFNKYKLRSDKRHFRIHSNVFQNIIENYVGNSSYTKQIPDFIFEDFGTNDYRIIWDALMKGDGSATMCQYSTKSKKLSEDFARLSLLIGKNPKIKISHGGTYRVRFFNKVKMYGCISKESCKKISYKGKFVYNLMVKDNHTVYAGIGEKFAWIKQSAYGITLYPGFRLFNPAIGSSITFVGRFLANKIRELCESKGYTVVRQDTDSAFVITGKDTLEEAVKVGKELEDDVNNMFSTWFKGMNNDISYMSIKCEKVYGLMFSGAEKKLYAGKIDWDWEKGDISAKPDIEIKGFATVKSDRSMFSRTLQKKIFNMIFEGKNNEDIKKFILDEIDKFYKLEYDWEYLGIPKAITKDLDEYGTKNPWITGVKWSQENLTGFQFSPKPYLLYLIPNSKYNTTSICYNNENEVPDDLPIDMQRMMEVCIYKVVEKIIDVLGIDSKLILNKIRNKAKNQVEITKWLR